MAKVHLKQDLQDLNESSKEQQPPEGALMPLRSSCSVMVGTLSLSEALPHLPLILDSLRGCTHSFSCMSTLYIGIVVPLVPTRGSGTQVGGDNLKPRATEGQVVLIQDSGTHPGEKKPR